MATDPVTAALQGAKSQLEKANKFTHSVTGDSTSAFAPKKEPDHIPGISAAMKPHEYSEAPYALAHELQAKKDNVDQYKKAAEPKVD